MLQHVIQLDGWKIYVAWDKLYFGDSFFVPSINTKFDKKAIRASARAAACGIFMKVCVEDDVHGIRVWVETPCYARYGK